MFLSNGHAFLKCYDEEEAFRWASHMENTWVATSVTGRPHPRRLIIEWARMDLEMGRDNAHPTRHCSLGAKWFEEAWRVNDLYYEGPPTGIKELRILHPRPILARDSRVPAGRNRLIAERRQVHAERQQRAPRDDGRTPTDVHVPHV